MSSRTSALRIFAVLATTLAFAACDEKGTTNPPVQVTPTISITPSAPITLTVGQQATVSGVVTGLTTNAVSYTSSVPAVATVNATTGVVTAVAAGTTTITAQSTEQANLRASVQVTVTAAGGGGGPSAPASISIAQITNLSGQVVDFSNAQGQINVVLNVDVPAGTRVDSVQVLVDGAVVCSQAFTAPTATEVPLVSVDGSAVPVQITCPINTAARNATTGAAIYANGPHVITARLRTGGATTVATQNLTVTFNNTNFITASISTSQVPCQTGGTNPGPGNLAPAGSLWCAGDVTVTLVPTIYSAGGASGQAGLSQATVSLVSSGYGVNGNTGCRTNQLATTPTASDVTLDPTVAAAQGSTVAPANNPTGAYGTGGTPTYAPAAGASPNCGSATATQTDTDASNGLSVTFPRNARMSATAGGVMEVEDVFIVNIQSTTTAGQQGPVCINPDPTNNPQNSRVDIFGAVLSCGNALGTSINPNTGAVTFPVNPLRIDNLGPRVTRFDITPNDCPAGTTCYINSPSFITTNTTVTGFPASTFQTVDYGVDSQTAAFTMGTTTANQAAVPGTFTTANETPTSSTNFAAVTVIDKLGNSSGARFASATPGTTNPTATGSQAFGIDITAPTCAFTDTPDVGFVLANELNPEAGDVFQITFSDASTPPGGPSGFPLNPVTRTQILQAPTITSGTAAACVTGTFNATTGACAPVAGGSNDLFAPADTDGYYTENGTVRDQAGNVCATSLVRVGLDDDVVPVVGAVSGPSIIAAGNNAVTFTAGAVDNIDLGTAQLQFDFGAVLQNLRVSGTTTLGTFGADVFTTNATVTVTDPSFIRSVETTAGGVPSGVVTNANNAELRVTDVAGNLATTNTDISTSVNAGGSFGSFTANNPALTAFTLTSTQTALCNGSTQDNAGVEQTTAACPVNPTSTTLTAVATGPQGTFANPFQRVNFYYTNPDGNTILIGQGSVSVTDITTPPGERRYTYTATWMPTALAQGAYQVFALGVDSQGRALQSNVIAHTVTND